MADGIFISYRREDSQHAAGRLVDRLTQSFGRDRIFMDVDAIEPGLDFLDVINAKVAESFVFLVVIGPGWANAAGADGRRRLDNPDDLVRLEIEAGLRQSNRIVPVLVDGAPMPSSAELPPSLHGLVRRQSVRLTHDAFGTDAERLIATLSRLPGFVEAGSEGKNAKPPGLLKLSVEQVLEMLETVPTDNRWVYKWPSIPPYKEQNARSMAGVPTEEEIAVLIDLTRRGSAKDALLLGRRRVYYRCWQSQPSVAAIPYGELREYQIARKTSATSVGWLLILPGLAFFMFLLIPTLVAVLLILAIGAVGSTFRIGPHKMFIRYGCSKQVFALLHAIKVQIAVATEAKAPAAAETKLPTVAETASPAVAQPADWTELAPPVVAETAPVAEQHPQRPPASLLWRLFGARGGY